MAIAIYSIAGKAKFIEGPDPDQLYICMAELMQEHYKKQSKFFQSSACHYLANNLRDDAKVLRFTEFHLNVARTLLFLFNSSAWKLNVQNFHCSRKLYYLLTAKLHVENV